MDFNDLNLTTDIQDKAIFLCLTSTSSLSQILRKKIEPRHFSSEVRQKVFKTITEFYASYKKSPMVDIVDEIQKKISQKRIKAEDEEMYNKYLMQVFSMPDFSEQHFIDNLDFFLKQRIVRTITNTLIKLQDQVDINPDKPLQEIKATVQEANNVLGRKLVESVLEDNPNSIYQRDFVTKFNIDPLDKQLGGGLKRGEYVVIQGYLGRGKSWCINHLAKMAVRFGYTPLVIPTEMANNTAKLRFQMSFSGMTEQEVFGNPVLAKSKIVKTMNKGSDIFLLSEEEKSIAVDELPAIVEDTEIRTGKKIDLILLDSADELLPPTPKQGTRYEKKINESTAIHTFLKNYAKDGNICIITTTQAQRRGETLQWLGASSVADNIDKFRKATIGLSINALEEERNKGHFRIWLFKHTSGSEGCKVWVKNDLAKGQFVKTYGRFNQITYDEYLEKQPFLEGIK